MAEDLYTLRGVLQDTRRDLLAKPNVVATGIGYKTVQERQTSALSIICSVTHKVRAELLPPQDRVPPAIDGVPVDVVATGPFHTLQARTGRRRPAPGGISIGHPDITAGTLGCLVHKDNRTVILSNNHVLANSNDGRVGDPILQPGPFDGGTSADRIADLTDFVRIHFAGEASDCSIAGALVRLLNALARIVGSATRLRAVTMQARENLVDAAVARPLRDDLVTADILEIGTIQDVARGELGTVVKKSGRTTGLTQGQILQVDVTVDVQYGPGQTARFTDQLLAGPMSQSGDSGSAVLDASNRLVGLLFAGSPNSTVINRIEHVFAALGLRL